MMDAFLFYALSLWFPASFAASAQKINALFFAVLAIYFVAGGVFLYHDSRTIHKDPFPDGSTCREHPSQPVYDCCAICGALKCTQDLVRIRQSWGFSPGMFGFDGVACQHCARRRVKRTLASIVALSLVILPLLAVIFAATSAFLPANLAAVLLITVGAIVLALLPFVAWSWRKMWRVVTTPLSTQPLLTTPTAQRLAEKAMVGDSVRFKRATALIT